MGLAMIFKVNFHDKCHVERDEDAERDLDEHIGGGIEISLRLGKSFRVYNRRIRWGQWAVDVDLLR